MTIISSIGSVLILGWLYFSYVEFSQFLGTWKMQALNSRGCCERIKLSLSEHYSRIWNLLDTYLVVQVPLILFAAVMQ